MKIPNLSWKFQSSQIQIKTSPSHFFICFSFSDASFFIFFSIQQLVSLDEMFLHHFHMLLAYEELTIGRFLPVLPNSFPCCSTSWAASLAFLFFFFFLLFFFFFSLPLFHFFLLFLLFFLFLLLFFEVYECFWIIEVVLGYYFSSCSNLFSPGL